MVAIVMGVPGIFATGDDGPVAAPSGPVFQEDAVGHGGQLILHHSRPRDAHGFGDCLGRKPAGLRRTSISAALFTLRRSSSTGVRSRISAPGIGGRESLMKRTSRELLAIPGVGVDEPLFRSARYRGMHGCPRPERAAYR